MFCWHMIVHWILSFLSKVPRKLHVLTLTSTQGMKIATGELQELRHGERACKTLRREVDRHTLLSISEKGGRRGWGGARCDGETQTSTASLWQRWQGVRAEGQGQSIRRRDRWHRGGSALPTVCSGVGCEPTSTAWTSFWITDTNSLAGFIFLTSSGYALWWDTSCQGDFMGV